MKFFRAIYLNPRLYYFLVGVVVVFSLGFLWPIFLVLGKILLAATMLLFAVDVFWLFNNNVRIVATRSMAKILSLGDQNTINLALHNKSGVVLLASVIDELPYQLQIRDFEKNFVFGPQETKLIAYQIRPTVRGAYHFGHAIVYVSSLLGLVKRRINTATPQMVPVYPSVIQMKKFELAANARLSQFLGVKKMRRIGHSYEFEQIKNYAQGDDYRSINWKATGRHNDLMVNQFQDERSQPVYCIIDKSRQMRLPFEGLSLLDYAINTSLVISNVALQKKDRAGLITFDEKIETIIKADNRSTQLRQILEALYNQTESMQEANYELLYRVLKNAVRNRSMLVLFTNLESKHQLERIKPILKRIASYHLLLVVFFENTELADYGKNQANDLTEAYLRTAALRMTDEKRYLIQELQQIGIHTAITRPEDLTITTLNKYLEFKARGMI